MRSTPEGPAIEFDELVVHVDETVKTEELVVATVVVVILVTGATAPLAGATSSKVIAPLRTGVQVEPDNVS